MIMKKNKIIDFAIVSSFSIVFIVIIITSCSQDFLDYTPKGKLSEESFKTGEHADNLVTAAYAAIGNDEWTYPFTHQWVIGSIRSDDAYKGGGSVPDQFEYDRFEQFYHIRVDQSRINMLWQALYEGVNRANEALRRLEPITQEELPKKTIRQAEARFLRGHFYFLLKILFKYPVWFDENYPKDELKNLGNREHTNDQLWDLIAADFQFAVDNLPDDQPAVGRANKVSASAYLAKVKLYQAYEQNEQHEVVNINQDKLEEVVSLTDYVINSGKHWLANDFAENFLTEYNNLPESVFAIQYSVDDGTPEGRVSKVTGLNYNMAPPYGCCDFHNPSQNMVNAFQTNSDGLPKHETFNETRLLHYPEDFWDNTVDPRLNHTIGIAGTPFKYDPEFIMTPEWRRAPHVYGTFSPMKELVHYQDPTFRKHGAFHHSALNIQIIRYSDVMLWKAEALIELGREDEALPIINEIRERAANSTERIAFSDGSPSCNYNIEPYIDGVNCDWTQDYARKALRFERRLEFAMESPRFFDLVRWGIAAEILNNYFEEEREFGFTFLANAYFEKGRDEYFPIPLRQIELTEGAYTQNNGW